MASALVVSLCRMSLHGEGGKVRVTYEKKNNIYKAIILSTFSRNICKSHVQVLHQPGSSLDNLLRLRIALQMRQVLRLGDLEGAAANGELEGTVQVEDRLREGRGG